MLDSSIVIGFLSSSLDKLFDTLDNKSHKTFTNLKKENVVEDIIINIVNDVERILGKDEYNRTVQDF